MDPWLNPSEAVMSGGCREASPEGQHEAYQPTGRHSESLFMPFWSEITAIRASLLHCILCKRVIGDCSK